MKKIIAAALLVLAGCAEPSQVSASLAFGAVQGDLTTVTIRIRNQGPRPTTPLLIKLSIEQKERGSWTRPEVVLHPAGFVLKKAEQQILRASLKLKPGTVRTTLTVQELQSGRMLQSQTTEKVISGTT